MAKLTGVKTLDMVGGEITKVEYGGAVYEKVESGREGDIGLRVKHGIDGQVTVGEFYRISRRRGQLSYIDEDGDNATFGGEGTGKFEYFRKVSESTPKTVKRKARVGERILITMAASEEPYDTGDVFTVIDVIGAGDVRVKETYRWIDYLEYEVIIEEESEPAPTFRKGDRVKTLVAGQFSEVGAGSIGNVIDVDAGEEKDDPYTIEIRGKYDSDYFRPQDLELVAKEEKSVRPTVGDIVKVVRKETYHNANVGDVVKIVKDDKDHQPYFCEFLDGDRAGWFRESEVELVEDEPYKPAEGDIVVITANTNNSRNAVGDIGKVGRVRGDGACVDVPGKTEGNGNYTRIYEMRPATDEEKAKYERAAAKSEFKVGDVVKITEDRFEHRVGEIKVIREFDEEDSVFSVGFNNLDGSMGGWDNFDNIEKISDKEAKFAKLGRKPDEFKRGDIVRIVKYQNGHSEGSIVEVANAHSYGLKVKGESSAGKGEFLADFECVEIIAPAESRVDE